MMPKKARNDILTRLEDENMRDTTHTFIEAREYAYVRCQHTDNGTNR